METAVREFVGRESECSQLDEALAELDAAGSMSVLLLTGEPGIGKSRLLSRLCADASRRGHLVLEGRASEYEEQLPFSPLRDAFNDYLVAQQPAVFSPLDDRTLAELGMVFPALGSGQAAGIRSTAEERFRLHEGFRKLLELLASDRPAVIALDDLHWSDAATLELLGYLVRRPPRAAVLLVLVTRTGPGAERLDVATAPSLREGRMRRLELGPISAAAATTMIGPRHGPDRVEQLLAESGGNPFYLDELLRAPLAPDGRALGDAAEIPGIPAAVVAALGSELDRLDESTRETAAAAAIAGESFDRDLLAAAAAIDPEEAGALVDELCACDLVRPTDVPRWFRFRHPIVRAAVYESAGPDARAAVHTRLAAALAAADAPAAERAIHVESSARIGDEAAIDLLVEAARSVEGAAPESAARWVGSALRLLPPGDPRRPALLAEQAGAFAASGRYELSRRALGEVLLELPEGAITARIGAAAACARLDHLLGRHVEAHELLRTHLAQLPEGLSEERLSLKLELGSDCFFRGDFDGMREWMRQVLEEAGPVGNVDIEAAAKGLLGCAEYMAGDAASAKALLEEFFGALAQVSGRRLAGHINTVAWCILCEVFVDQIDEAIVHSERALEAARATGKGQITSLIRIAAALAMLWRGRIAEGNALADQAVDATILSGNRQFECWARWTRSWGALLAGDVPAAVAEARGSLDVGTGLSDPVSALAGCHLAEALLESGDPEGCRAEVLHAVGGPELPLVERPYRARWYELLARAEIASDRLAAAEDWTDRAERCAEDCGLAGRRVEALRSRARLTLAQGDARAAAGTARLAAELAGESNLVIWEGVARTIAGEALAAVGEADAAIEELERARRMLEGAGAARYADAASRELRTLGRRVPRRGVRGSSANGVEGLSGRESEVASLAAAGHTNREIAAAMFISDKTVEKHMARVFDKLGVGSRAEVAHRLGQESER